MSQPRRKRRLHDTYGYPGFVPAADVRGVFGDHMAVVLTLNRQRKKQRVEFVVVGIEATTTRRFVEYATCRAATNGSIWRSRFVALLADAAGR